MTHLGLMLFFTILVLVVAGAAGEEKRVEMSVEPGVEVTQGDRVTVTCSAYRMSMLDSLVLQRIVDNKLHIIGTNGGMEHPFTTSGRHSLETLYPSAAEALAGLSIKLTVTIEGIRGGDGGRYGCFLKMKQGGKKKEAFEDITVLVPPKSVTILGGPSGKLREANDEAPLVLRKGDEITCTTVVEGSTEDATMKITLDDKDVTKDFVSRQSEKDENVEGLVTLESTKTMSKPLKAQSQDDQRTLVCEAEVGGSKLKAETRLVVEYEPEIECKKSVEIKEIGAERVSLSCEATSNPRIDRSYWEVGNVQIFSLSGRDQRREAITIDLPNGRTKFTLRFLKKITESDFKDYKLILINSIGKSEKTVKLHKKGEPLPAAGHSPLLLVASTLWTFLATFLSLIVL